MRQQFIEADDLETAEEFAPWASIIVEVEGGFHAYESFQDYEISKKQF
jgi:hypothetical protein